MREQSIVKKQAGVESTFVFKPGEIENICLTCNSKKCNGNCKTINQAEKNLKKLKKK